MRPPPARGNYAHKKVSEKKIFQNVSESGERGGDKTKVEVKINIHEERE